MRNGFAGGAIAQAVAVLRTAGLLQAANMLGRLNGSTNSARRILLGVRFTF